jgi:hypothetical protein
MRIENDVKLDFKDVLIRPKRSTLTTRSQVDISREFRFRHTGTEYAGIPIVASNMDSTGTFQMALALDDFKLSVALHKHYEVDEIVAFFRALERKSAAFYSMGHPGRRRGEAPRRHGEGGQGRRVDDPLLSASTSRTATPRASCASSRRCAPRTRTS